MPPFTPIPDESTAVVAATGAAASASAVAPITADEIAMFGIPEEWISKNITLVNLILRTESMKDEERKYWFQLLPVMNEEQVTRLQTILQNERDQLATLDSTYATEMEHLAAERVVAEKQEAAHAAEEARVAAEAGAAAKDAAAQEEVLRQIASL